MKSRKFRRGRWIGETSEVFTQDKTYRAKFVVFEHCVLMTYQAHTYQTHPKDWEFEDEWEVA